MLLKTDSAQIIVPQKDRQNASCEYTYFGIAKQVQTYLMDTVLNNNLQKVKPFVNVDDCLFSRAHQSSFGLSFVQLLQMMY